MVRKNFMTLFRQNNKDKGFVLITALMVIFLIVALVTSVALITASDLRAAARARAIVVTRLTAESVADAIYGTIASAENNYETIATRDFTSDRNASPDASTHPLVPESGVPGTFGAWFNIDSSGRLNECVGPDFLRLPCFKAKIVTTTPAASLFEVVRLTVVARDGCVVDGSDVSRCIYRKFEQVLQTRSFIETAQLTDNELPSPGLPRYSDIYKRPGINLPFPVAYLPSDNLQGKIFTNDDAGYSGLYYCGNTNSIGGTFNVTDNRSVPSPLGAGECTTNPTFSANPLQAPQFLPTQINTAGVNDLITSQNVFKDLAGGSSLNNYNQQVAPPGYATFEFVPATPTTPSTITVNGIPGNPYPANGVIFVDGNARISGSYSRDLSIVASGNIAIVDDLTLSRGPLVAEFDGSGSPPDETEPMLGILSGGNIEIVCPGSGECPDRKIVATLSAPNGTIYNDRWDSSTVVQPVPPNPPSPPEITIYGTLIAGYRPVFGSFYSQDDNPGLPAGSLQNGWAKKIVYDLRLRLTQPPYFFRTSQASVVRSGLEVSRCTESFCS